MRAPRLCSLTEESVSRAVSIATFISSVRVPVRVAVLATVLALVCSCVWLGTSSAVAAEGTGSGASNFGFAAVPKAQIVSSQSADAELDEDVDEALNAVDHATESTAIDGFFGEGITESFVLETTVQRDISAGLEFIESEEEVRRFEEKKREQAHIDAINAKRGESYANGGVGVYDVDFSCGREQFVTTWTTRINSYLSDSPLAGYGAVFAEAAWQYGVDPRWSPAISNTESTKGRNCFAAHNAWGWSSASWSNWAAAINSHVAGLSSLYGYTISRENAERYCPPNATSWYYDTLSEMQRI